MWKAYNLINEEKPVDAERVLNSLYNDHPHDPRVMGLLAQCQMKLEHYGAAYNTLRRCVELLPNKSEPWNNYGMACLHCGLLDEGERALKRAIGLESKQPWAAVNNMALCMVNQGEPLHAIEWADKGLALKAKNPEAMVSRGYACLMLGRWKEGWEGYEHELHGSIRKPVQYQKEPYWDGKLGINLVVRGEQGIGDEISFASVLPDAIKAQKSVVFECDRRLEGLFKRSFPGIPIYGTRFDKTITWQEEHPVDASCLMGTLSRHHRNALDEFPGTPYLIADPERRIQWRALLASLGAKPKIGIAWSGGLKSTFKGRRSVGLEDLLPILKQDATFVSLQYKKSQDEIDEFEEKHGIKIHHWTRATEVADYDETAALVAELDMVISVQTAVVHLCGALGKKCWVLVPSKPHWRYGLNGDSLPWYKSVKLYRQKKDWDWIINKVSSDLCLSLTTPQPHQEKESISLESLSETTA